MYLCFKIHTPYWDYQCHMGKMSISLHHANSHFLPPSLPPLRIYTDAHILLSWPVQEICRRCGLILWTRKDNLNKIGYQNMSTCPQILVMFENTPTVRTKSSPTWSYAELVYTIKWWIESEQVISRILSILTYLSVIALAKTYNPLATCHTDCCTGYSTLTQSQKHLCPPFPLPWKILEH